MQVPPKFRPSPPADDDLDPDWAPQLPSIWDDPDEEAELADLAAAALPWPLAGSGPGWLDAEDWVQAEHRVGRALADTVGAVVRLDERLLSMDADAREGARLRLALQAVPDLLWAEGARLRPEHLALADADRIGGGEAAPVLARASWAVRRMTAGSDLDSGTIGPATLRAFLGLRAVGDAMGHDLGHDLGDDSGPRAGDAEGACVVPDLLEPRSVDPAALDEWCAAVTTLGALHPLTRAVAGGALWTGLGVTDTERLLEPAMVMGVLGAAAGQGGVRAVPPGTPRAGGGGDTVQRLAKGLARLADGARGALMQLDRAAAWHARAAAGTADLKGRGPDALIALLAARPVVSARDIAEAIELTDRHARRLVNAFAARGLVRELTGHSRFRFWKATL